MHVTSAKAGPHLRCVPGWCRFASGNAAHCKIADARLRKRSHPNPDRVIASLCGNPFAADAPTNGHLDQPQPHAFPIGSTQPPAASSLGGFSTRAETGPAATVAPRPASKNLHRNGPCGGLPSRSATGATFLFEETGRIDPILSFRDPFSFQKPDIGPNAVIAAAQVECQAARQKRTFCGQFGASLLFRRHFH